MGEQRSILREALACASLSVATIHAFAFSDHTHHRLIASFFVLMVIAQAVSAALLIVRPTRNLYYGIAALNAGVVGTWVASRTTGLPFVPGAEIVESVGPMDAIATGVEVAMVVGAVLLAAPHVLRRLRSTEFAAAGLAMGIVLLAVPPLTGAEIGAHGHADGTDSAHAIAHAHKAPGVNAAGHGHTKKEAKVHGHGAEADTAHADATHAPGKAHVMAAHDESVPHPSDVPHDHAKKPVVAKPSYRGVLGAVRYGPFDVPAAAADGTPGVHSVTQTRLQKACNDCFITAFTPDLEYADGSSANYDTGVMLHHSVIGDSSAQDATCGRFTVVGPLGRRFFASGNERTEAVFPAPYAYKVNAGGWWTGNFELMNFERKAQSVFFELEVRKLPSSDTSVKPITPVWMDMNNCANSQYAIPAGRTADAWSWESTLTGRVVWAAGHVHNWGLSTTLSNASAGQRMCRSVAGYGSDPTFKGNIESMSVCSWDRLGTVKNGETLRITTVYESPQARTDVMGIVVAYVYETTDLSGGSKAPSSVTDHPEGAPPDEPSDEHQH